MQLCLFSVSYAGFWGQQALSLDDFLVRAAQLGYPAVMLAGKRPHLSPLDATPERISQLRERLAELHLQCPVLGAYTDLSGVGAAEVPHQELQIANVERLSQIGAQIGAKIVRVFTAYEPSGQNLMTLWQRSVVTLKEMCDRAAASGVTIAIQNHHDQGVHSDALLELLHDIDRPNCRLGCDAWSPGLRGENLYEAAKKLAPYSVITTNADYIRIPRYKLDMSVCNYQPQSPDLVKAVPFGTGCLDYQAFFHGLRDGGFDGIATFEMCWPLRGGGGEANLDACASGYLTWMREHLSWPRDAR